jgi:hypothetical protein
VTLYGFALFVHIVAAILLVGGSAYAHLSTALIPRARTVDGVRSHVDWLYTFVKASGPIAGVVLAAGLYLAFAGSWWSAGWPGVSLALFLLGGVAAPTLVDPAVTRIKRLVDDLPDGPITPGLAAELADRRVTLVGWTLGGIDLAIVFLMTNKPGLLVSIVAGVIGIAVGAAVGIREVRRTTSVVDAPPGSPPAAPPAAPPTAPAV